MTYIIPENDTAVNPWPGGPRSNDGVIGLSRTIRERVGTELRERILSGGLVRGARLDLDELAQEFHTSRTPVREAILMLSQEGLTQITPRSRATVVGLTPQDVRDNFTVIAVLSGLAAELAAERMTEDEVARITDLGRKLALVICPELSRLNWQFHREINVASHSAPLLNQMRVAGQLVPQTFFAVVPEQVTCSRGEHKEILDALLSRDPVQARQATERHFRGAGELLSARLEANIRAGQSQSDASAGGDIPVD